MTEGPGRDCLIRFCKKLLDPDKHPARMSPEVLAREFASRFQILPPVDLDVLIVLAKRLGINLGAASLPYGMRGFHHRTKGNYEILYQEGEWIGSIKYTILHEIGEIIEGVFADLCCNYRPPKGPAMERRVNRFAAAVLLPWNGFRDFALASELNPLRLQQHYEQAYSSILLRLTQVLDAEIPLQVLLYENQAVSAIFDLQGHLQPWELATLAAQRADLDQYVASLVSNTSAFRSFYEGPWRNRKFWVNRGDSITHNILAKEAVERREHLRRRRFPQRIVFELEPKNLYCDIWLVTYYGVVAKVIVVGIPLFVRHDLERKHHWGAMRPIAEILPTAFQGLLEYLETTGGSR